jgi:ribosome assembly protein 4
VIKQGGGKEILVSGSDDFTLYLWHPTIQKQPILRLTGHQQPINCVVFSPDGQYIASASFDKSIKLWNSVTGKFMHSLRGHVEAVYMCNWSADSRLLVSASKDSTMKVWNVSTGKMSVELPGHSDAVFACDWSADGERVASGGRDRVVKIWMR